MTTFKEIGKSIEMSNKFEKKFSRSRLYIRIGFVNTLTQANAREEIKRNLNKVKKSINAQNMVFLFLKY